jgi:hypothetical protein
MGIAANFSTLKLYLQEFNINTMRYTEIEAYFIISQWIQTGSTRKKKNLRNFDDSHRKGNIRAIKSWYHALVPESL